MKKLYLALFIFALTSSVTYAFGDFVRLDSPYNNSRYYSGQRVQNNFDKVSEIMTTDPYESISNGILKKLSSNKKINQKASKLFNNINLDYEYLLSKMERKQFGSVYTNLDIESRLDRLEEQIFGASQDGNHSVRLNRLKRAFSAQSIRTYKRKQNRLQEFFASGYPTSIPASGDYYSSLNDDFTSY